MTYDIYRYIFYGGAVLAIIMFVVSAILFVYLRIPNVIGDLSGANARKAIERIRSQNETSGEKVYKPSVVNRERGKITDRISPSGNIIQNPSGPFGGGMETEKIATQQLVEAGSEETTVLSAGETTLLDAQQTANVIFEIEYEITLIHTEERIG